VEIWPQGIGMTLRRTWLLAALGALVPALAGAGERSAPAPVGFCSVYGPGFQEVPGTRSCIRIGGRVRSEVQASSSRGKAGERSQINAEGRLKLDARTETEQGALRTYIQVRTGRDRGN
jgi:hypothetical protein